MQIGLYHGVNAHLTGVVVVLVVRHAVAFDVGPHSLQLGRQGKVAVLAGQAPLVVQVNLDGFVPHLHRLL